jgi:phage head maturation protease
VRNGQPGTVTVGHDNRNSADTEAPAARTMFGYFAKFGEWTEVDSVFEGRFLERNTPGAFRATLKDSGRFKVLFQHRRW